MTGTAPRTDNGTDARAVVLFDGECVVCSGWVDFLLPRDTRRRLRFGTLQSDEARALLRGRDAPDPLPDSVILVEPHGVSTQSTAALRAMAHLPGAWSAVRILFLVPRPLRDLVYRWIARNRYRWFGKREACYMPDPGERERFL